MIRLPLCLVLLATLAGCGAGGAPTPPSGMSMTGTVSAGVAVSGN